MNPPAPGYAEALGRDFKTRRQGLKTGTVFVSNPRRIFILLDVWRLFKRTGYFNISWREDGRAGSPETPLITCQPMVN